MGLWEVHDTYGVIGWERVSHLNAEPVFVVLRYSHHASQIT